MFTYSGYLNSVKGQNQKERSGKRIEERNCVDFRRVGHLYHRDVTASVSKYRKDDL